MTVHDLKTCPQALLEAYIPSKFWFKHFLVHGPYLNLLQVTPEIKDASKAVFSAAKGKGLINQQTLQQMCLGWGLLWLSSHWELLLQKMHQFTPKKNHHFPLSRIRAESDESESARFRVDHDPIGPETRQSEGHLPSRFAGGKCFNWIPSRVAA